MYLKNLYKKGFKKRSIKKGCGEKGIAKISFLPFSLSEYFFYIKWKDKTAWKS